MLLNRFRPRLRPFALVVAGWAAALHAQSELGEAPVAPSTQETAARTPFVTRAFSTRAVTGTATTASSPWISISNRAAVRSFYKNYYLPSSSVPMQWTGSLSGTPGVQASGSAGDTSAAFKQATIDRINWFRSMAGVPAVITLGSTFSTQDQQAALMMAANNDLSHSPPTNWQLYTSAGASAAGKSNLALGRTGARAVTAYMTDYGLGNEPIGHRRWLLYPQSKSMGTGDIPATGPFASSNATWVLDGNFGTTRPATRDGYVAWPPPGFVPYEVVFPRWSFTYPDADFSTASVTMTNSGNRVPVALEPLDNPGYGENTLVWVWQGIDATTTTTPIEKPAADTTYNVQINGVKIGGQSQNFSYAVTVFDPDTAPPTYQPDLWLANWGQSNWQGKNSTNSNAAGQTLSAPVAAGRFKKFKIKIQNDGNVGDAFLLRGSPASDGFTVKYFSGATDITSAVIVGTYKVHLAPAARVTIRVKIGATITAASSSAQTCTITAQSGHDPSKTDTVSATVTVP